MKRIHATALPFIAVLFLATGCDERPSATADPATNPATVAGSKLPPLLRSTELPKLTPTIIDEPGIRMFGDIEVRFEFYPKGSRRSKKDEGWNACNDTRSPFLLTLERLYRATPSYRVMKIKPGRCRALYKEVPADAVAVLSVRRHGIDTPAFPVETAIETVAMVENRVAEWVVRAGDSVHPCVRANALMRTEPVTDRTKSAVEKCGESIEGESVEVLSRYFGKSPPPDPARPWKCASIVGLRRYKFDIDNGKLKNVGWAKRQRCHSGHKHCFGISYSPDPYYTREYVDTTIEQSDTVATLAFPNSRNERLRAYVANFKRYQADYDSRDYPEPPEPESGITY